MSFGWNSCYPNCVPVTVMLQPPPFTMSLPGASICCPDQSFCLDPCRPSSPSLCAPALCAPSACVPTVCAPATCAPVSCAPASCAPLVCNTGISRGRYNSCLTSCSLPPRKFLPRVQSTCDPCTKF